MDLERGIGMYWVQSEEMLPYWCHASPLRTLFHWWMAHNGRQLLHAAAVGWREIADHPRVRRAVEIDGAMGLLLLGGNFG